MRSLFVLLFLTFSVACVAADLTVRVADPGAAVVAGSEVSIFPAGSSSAAAVQITSAEGLAHFSNLVPGPYRVEVRAPSFATAVARTQVPAEGALHISLKLASLAETIVVSATRTPVPVDESGTRVELLDASDLRNMQPIAASDALRFLPGAVVNTAGQDGGQASLFVRGGESRYNKVIIDGVPVNEPGGTFDFGVVPITQVERLEFVRGAESVLYGTDAMTSVVQLWSAAGRTEVPEIRFGADGGTVGTARGYASVAGARGRFDYNVFGQQDATQGQGPNDDYSNSLQGANLGMMLSPKAFLRVRARHANSRSGVPGQWVFDGQQVPFNGGPSLLNPDIDAYARQNNFIGSAELTVTGPNHWQHRFTGYEYSHKGTNADNVPDRGCDLPAFNFFDCFFSSPFNVNTAGFHYQGDYTPRAWTRTTFGYEFDDENGSFDSSFATLDPGTGLPTIGISNIHGLRRNHSLFAQEAITWKRLTARAGFRFVHNEGFGNKGVPQVALSYVVRQGDDTLGPTRLTGSYSQGIKEPRFEETFGITGTFPANPNLGLLPEQDRALDAGFTQSFFSNRHWFAATYFNNLFRDQIQFDFVNNQYFNVAKSIAHGAEFEWHSRLTSNLSATASYVYTSGQILVNPGHFQPDPLTAGNPLLRRPRHLGSLLVNYAGRRWGAELGGSFVGRRFDSDFLFGAVPPVDHTPGYARVDLGAWYAINRHVTAYANVYNALDRHYEEVAGYPALKANFRAGMRFRFGGE